jgi:hypothetical protein
MEALKLELDACLPIKNVSLFLKKAWRVHIHAFGLHAEASNNHAHVSVESRASEQTRAGFYTLRIAFNHNNYWDLPLVIFP